jgi:hypothetical protein
MRMSTQNHVSPALAAPKIEATSVSELPSKPKKDLSPGTIVSVFVGQADVVTLNQIERKLPTSANTEPWNFNDLVCWSIAQIRLIPLDVTTPLQRPTPSDLTKNASPIPS